jgi:hypothetical protein
MIGGTMKVDLNDDVGAVVEQFAKREKMEVDAAAARLIEVAVSRLNALKRYAKNQKKKAAEAAPEPPKKAAKKVAKKKAPKTEVVVEEAQDAEPQDA